MKNKKTTEKNEVDLFEKFLLESSDTIIKEIGIGDITLYLSAAVDDRQRSDSSVLLKINYNEKYKTASLFWYENSLTLFKKKSYSPLVQAITHEMAHIVTSKLTEAAERRYITEEETDLAIENTTESVATIIRKLLIAKNIKLI